MILNMLFFDLSTLFKKKIVIKLFSGLNHQMPPYLINDIFISVLPGNI